MDFASAVTCLYLLFPFYGKEMQWFSNSIKIDYSSPQALQKKKELMDYFSLNQLPQLNFEEMNEDEIIEAMSEEAESGKKIVEKYYLDSLNNLRQFEFGEEKLVSLHSSEKNKSYLTVNDDVFSRVEYDSMYRIKEKTVWNNSKNKNEIKLVSNIKWNYGSEENQSGVSSVEENFIEYKKTLTEYNLENLPVQIEIFSINDDEEKKSEKLYLKKIGYDEKLQVIFEEEIDIKNDFTRKRIYKYQDFSSMPDVEYYENGLLRIKTEYLEKNVYVEKMYFDKDYSVETKYENDRKVSEIFFIKNKEVRRQNYEN